jgi:hypothetical protein
MKLWVKPQVRPIRCHDLRHTTGSLLFQTDANPAAVQRIMRHSDPRITTDVYGHLAPGYLKAESIAFDSASLLQLNQSRPDRCGRECRTVCCICAARHRECKL